HREPRPECPRNYAHCLEARRNPEPSYVVWLPIVVSYRSSCIPPSLSSDKKARRSKPHSRTDPEPMPHSRDEYLSWTPRASRAIKWSNCTRRHRELLMPVDLLNAHASSRSNSSRSADRSERGRKITRCTVPRKRLDDLARNPLSGRICRHPKRYRRQHKEVDCRDTIDMIGQK